MGQQIIKQPNGKYCIFSSIVDNIVMYDMTAEEIIEVWTNEAREKIVKEVNNIIKQIENGDKPYFQFTKNYNDVIEIIKTIHGEIEAKNIERIIES